MADYNIKAEITADASGFESGVKKAQKASKNLSTSLSKVIQGLGKNGLVGALGAVGLASQGLTLSLSAVIKIGRKVSETMTDLTNSYKTQLIAERQLDTAIQNNPFVTGESAKALKQFASEMQKVSNYGDEELIPMMADLIAKGRTETETMQIMSVAMDVSAGMGISLDTAITQLNATLNGNIGRLGQQNAELKNLTEEELKNGKAIEILGNKYKGFSQATADTSKQLANIKSDFKEALGEFTLPLSDMWNKFWSGFYTKGIEIIKKFNDYFDTQIIGKRIVDNLVSNAMAVSASQNVSVGDVLSDLRYLKEQLSYLNDNELSTLAKTLEGQKKRTEAEERMLTVTNQILQSRKLQAEQDKKDAEREAEKARLVEEQAEKENGIAELKKKHLEKIAEQERKWENIKKVTGEEVSLEEKLKFYQDDLVAIMTEAGGQITTNNQYYKDQMAIINKILQALGDPEYKSQWDSKLLDQRIEMLEKDKELAVSNAEEKGEKTYEIEKYYNDRLLDLKLERLELEKEEALKNAGDNEEEKTKIEEYYSNETKKIYDELGNYKKEKNKEEEKAQKKSFAEMLKVAQNFTKQMGTVFKKVAETIKKVFSTIGNVMKSVKNVFTKLFDFNINDALDNLLKFEDSILTFFVETLPQLPNFLKSAFQSIVVLIDTLLSVINIDGVVKMITDIIDSIAKILVEKAPAIVDFVGKLFFSVIEALPSLISNFLKVVGTYISEIGKYITDNADRLTNDLVNIVQSVVQGISDFITGGGWKNLLSALLTIQKALETAVTENLPAIVDTIIDMLPDLIQFLIDSIVSASRTLAKLIKPILKLVVKLIEAIIEVAFSEEVLDASMEVIEAFIEALVDVIINMLPKILPKLIAKIIKFFVGSLGKIVVAIVKGLVQAFAKTDWKQVIKDCFQGFIDFFKELFGIHSPSTLFEGFGLNIVEGLVNGLKGIAEAVNIILQPVYELFSTFFDGILSSMTNAFNTLITSAEKLTNTVFSKLEKITIVLSDMLNPINQLKNIKDVVTLFTDLSKITITNLKNDLSNLSGFLLNITSISITSGLKSIEAIFNSLSKIASNGLKQTFAQMNSALLIVNNSISSVINTFSKIGTTITDVLNNLPGSSLINLFEKVLEKALEKMGFLATGTQSAQGGLYMVGEAGPELIRFHGGEEVINNRNTQKLLSESGKASNTFNVTFNNMNDTSAFAMIQQLKQYNRQMAINGVL